MPADVHITKMIFKRSSSGYIAYVQFVYSNGSQSPEFDAPLNQHERYDEATLVLDELNRPIKKVKGSNN